MIVCAFIGLAAGYSIGWKAATAFEKKVRRYGDPQTSMQSFVVGAIWLGSIMFGIIGGLELCYLMGGR